MEFVPPVCYVEAMTKTLELAMAKAAELPEAAQEVLGLNLLERIEAMARLRADLQAGIDELDAGLGRPLDIQDVIRRGRERFAEI
jgi:hypothetical protein